LKLYTAVVDGGVVVAVVVGGDAVTITVLVMVTGATVLAPTKYPITIPIMSRTTEVTIEIVVNFGADIEDLPPLPLE